MNNTEKQNQEPLAGDESQREKRDRKAAEELSLMKAQYEEDISRLKLREEELMAELGQLKANADLLSNYNTMMMQLMIRRDGWILVVDQTGNIFYCNKFSKKWSPYPNCETCGCRLSIRPQILEYHSQEPENEWEFGDSNGKWYYHIHSYCVEWQGSPAYAHVIEDVTQERIRENKLREMAYRDGVTGVYNLHYFTREAKRLLRRHQSFSFVFMDLDHLKDVNDTYGHQEGDAYISLVSRIVMENIRSRDTFARIGGDEFGIIFHECSPELAEERLAKIREQVENTQNLPYCPDISYGVVYVDKENRKSFSEIIKEADERMYRNKRRTRK